MQGGGAVWYHGGIDGRPNESLRFDLHDGDGWAEDDGGEFRSVHTRRYLWSWPESRGWMWPGIRPDFTLSVVLVVVLYHCMAASACMIVVCKGFSLEYSCLSCLLIVYS